MTPRLVAFLFALSFVAIWPASAAEIVKETVEIQGISRTYQLYVPEAAKAVASPLVIILHGSGQRAIDLVKLWTGLADSENFIVMGIDAFKRDGWRLREDNPAAIHDMIDAVKTQHAVDGRRVYLFGHSAGAVYALALSMLESEYFAAVAIHGGAWTQSAEFRLSKYATRKIPLAMFIGDHDQHFSLDAVHDTEGALRKEGFSVEVIVLKHQAHLYEDSAPQIDRDIWTFFKNHPLDRDPRYTVYK